MTVKYIIIIFCKMNVFICLLNGILAQVSDVTHGPYVLNENIYL